jgi:CHAT domain-containing protein/tetratricopeptide (TPR) repeat protein
MKYLLKGRYDSALYYADEAAAIMRGNIGENNLQYCNTLNDLAVSHFYLGNYKKAKYYILKEVSLRESMKAINDIKYLTCLEEASVICRRSGSYEEALTLIKKADQKSLRIYGSTSPGYANTLVSYAGVCHDMGCSINDMVYLKEEEAYLKKAEAIYLMNGEKAKHEEIIDKSDQAVYNNNIGNSPKAELLLQEVVSFCKMEYGQSGTGYASALNNLAVLYYNTGNYKLAEKYFIEAVDIYSKSPEAGSINTGICINNLGALYHEMGNFKIAEKLFSDAQKILEKGSQGNNPAFAVVLNNVAAVYLMEEYFASPETKSREKLVKTGKILQKADSVFRMNCQVPHPYYQAIGTNLAIWYNLVGDTKKSIQMLYDVNEESNISLRVVAMMNKMSISCRMPLNSDQNVHYGPDPVIIPVSVKLIDQVSAANAKNNGPAESDAFTTALLRMVMGKANNVKKAVGPYHPAYANVLKSLIVAYGSFDDLKSEEALTLEYIDVINHKTLQDFSFLSDNEKELYYQTRLPDMNDFIAYTLLRKRKNPAITGFAYDNILLNKGLMLKSSTAMRLAILNSNDPVLLKKYDDWIDLQKEISVLYSTPVELRTKDVTDLENKANALEKSLVESSQDFSDYRKATQISWKDVRNNLKPDEAAIEFTDFKKREKDGGDAVIYCALIVRSNSEYPEMIKLFNEDQLKAIIINNDENNISGINKIYGTAKNPDERLYNLIWKPIEEYLSGVKSVIISPSGLLFKISFPAISNGKDVYLCDKYQIEVKGSTGNKAGQNLFSQVGKPSALVFGGIQYSRNSSDLQIWKYLEGTKNEGDEVKSILEKGDINVNYLSDYNATETYFKQNAQKYNILHLATHGFFFADPNEVRFEEKKQEVEYGEVTFRGASRGFGVNSFVNNENPLMRSGLVLAGANDVWTKTEKGETDDGVLTAQEVTQIDMRKNDLVVLSACETGLGDIKGNEGVYGLQRALKMAGVKYIIMSLWEIPDKETVEFMGAFYKNLLRVKDIRDAFSQAQKELRAKYDPYFWGAFVLME